MVTMRLLIISLAFLMSLIGLCKAKAHYSDHVILSHRWPISECTDWMQEDTQNACNIPANMDWIIGGLWPYRFKAELPTSCNDSIPADDKVLKELRTQLLAHWPSIQTTTQNITLWHNEYKVHGTCALGLDPFNNTENYFKAALKRLSKYNMTNILTNAKIIPGAHYSINQILTAVKKGLKGVTPAIKCMYHNATKGVMLEDIYTCYDTKAGEIIDCQKLKGGFSSGCPGKLDKEIIYFPSMDYPTPHKFPRALIAFLVIFFGTLTFIGSFFGYKQYLKFKERRNYNSMT